jgi:pilus assembly protein Flp/PilA
LEYPSRLNRSLNARAVDFPLPQESWTMQMKSFKQLLRDDRGGEILEYALIAGLVVVAAIAVISAVGVKVLARWTSLNSRM